MNAVTKLTILGACLAGALTGQAAVNVGFRVATVGGVRTALWYPTSATAGTYYYPGTTFIGTVVAGAAPTTSTRYPLVVFSHGMGSCGMQSVFFTEELARRGYVVAAPDHQDASCASDGSAYGLPGLPDSSYFNPFAWTDQTYVDRRNDVTAVMNALIADPQFGLAIDVNKIAIAGHSLGGYVAAAMVGGWSTWKDSRLKASLMFAPYIQPFLLQKRLTNGVRVPVMYQTGTLDYTMSPMILRDGGAYDMSNPPKYVAELTNQGHFDFTMNVCGSWRKIADCIANVPNAAAINDLSFRFFDEALRKNTAALTTSLPPTVPASAVNLYKAQEY
jgi:predicted dienelactone hydrolase